MSILTAVTLITAKFDICHLNYHLQYKINLISGKDNNFKKALKEKTSGFGIPYDYNSVMHYSEKAFSINGNPTIVAKVCSQIPFRFVCFFFLKFLSFFKSSSVKMGQREGFSRGDVSKIRTMYKCPGKDENNSQEGGILKPGGLLSLLFGQATRFCFRNCLFVFKSLFK